MPDTKPAAAPAFSLDLDLKVGKYDIQKMLGKGATGTVYLAKDTFTGKEVALKKAVDESLEKSATIEKVVVVRRTGSDVDMAPDRDYWWHDLMETASTECEPVELDSEHPLFILYTSGSTGKPKGVLHTTAGYLLGTAMTTQWVFDLKDDDTFWCTADIGWVTGHSYIVYGPLSNGAITLNGGTILGSGLLGEAIGFDDGGGSGVGRAVWTDSRGDRVFSTLRGEPVETGRHIIGTITGGTGRYAGIAGEYELTWQYVIRGEGEAIQGRSTSLRGRIRREETRP